MAGGLKLLAETIRSVDQIDFDAAAIVNFAGFQQVVEARRGEHVRRRGMTSIHVGYQLQGRDRHAVHAPVGRPTHVPDPRRQAEEVPQGHATTSRLGGAGLLRQRHILANGDGDYGRQRHQQQFLKAVFKKIVTSYVATDQAVRRGGEGRRDDDRLQRRDQPHRLGFAMKGIGQDGLITMKTNAGKFDPVEGTGYEQLNTESLDMLAVVREHHGPVGDRPPGLRRAELTARRRQTRVIVDIGEGYRPAA